ncbi:metal ABC transporter permease [Aquabacterium parvum]|uniref:metal ABC transporter permease n=1 Tax=Aquabacterium parvum TaxID=70584 RepID=UPI000718D6DC|nr:metal ABC transporter permease [Aquabacterium parvum]
MIEGLHPIDWGIVGPALLAALLVLATHVPLGRQVLRKGIVFIDLAIAQIAGLGLIAAHTLGWEPQGWAVQATAMGAAAGGALLMTWMERRWPDIQEALIGVLFVLASSSGILLLANNPHGGEHLQDLLVGQVLWVTSGQLQLMAGLTAVLLALWFGLGERLGRTGFYLLFAVAVTASVQLVGVYLVFSCLIMPALAVRHLPPRAAMLAGWLTGGLGCLLGLCLSAMFDLPSGAVMVACVALSSLVTAWLSPAEHAASAPHSRAG